MNDPAMDAIMARGPSALYEAHLLYMERAFTGFALRLELDVDAPPLAPVHARVLKASLNTHGAAALDAPRTQGLQVDINVLAGVAPVPYGLFALLHELHEGAVIRLQVVRVGNRAAHALVFLPREHRQTPVLAFGHGRESYSEGGQ